MLILEHLKEKEFQKGKFHDEVRKFYVIFERWEILLNRIFSLISGIISRKSLKQLNQCHKKKQLSQTPPPPPTIQI